jgi:hypothetical protein
LPILDNETGTQTDSGKRQDNTDDQVGAGLALQLEWWPILSAGFQYN